MKWLPTVAVGLALAALVLVVLASPAAWVPVTLSAVCAGSAIGLVWSGQAVARDLAVRRLVTLAYRAGADQVGLSHLSEVLPTPDVLRARSDALRAEAEVLAQRYANGDASDY